MRNIIAWVSFMGLFGLSLCVYTSALADQKHDIPVDARRALALLQGELKRGNSQAFREKNGELLDILFTDPSGQTLSGAYTLRGITLPKEGGTAPCEKDLGQAARAEIHLALLNDSTATSPKLEKGILTGDIRLKRSDGKTLLLSRYLLGVHLAASSRARPNWCQLYERYRADDTPKWILQ